MIATRTARRPSLSRQSELPASQAPPAPLRATVVPGSLGATRTGRPYTELYRLTDTVVIASVMTAAFLLTNPHVGDLQEFLAMRMSVKNSLLLVAFFAIWQVIFTATNLPSGWAGRSRYAELVQVGLACSLAALVAAVVPFVGLSHSFGPSAVALFWITAPPATLATRRVVRAAAEALRRVTRSRQVIIVGSGPLAYWAYQNLCACPDARCDVLGFVDTNDRITSPEIRRRHLGEFDELEAILVRSNVDLVLIALPVKSQYCHIEEAIRVCERVGVESRYLTEIFHGELARQEYDPDVGIPSVAMKVVDDDLRTVLKRVFDLVAAVLGLFLLSPLLAVIALAIRLTSRGPVVFAQERLGLNRRIFRMYKFRTMVADAEALQATLEHLNEAGGPVFKIRDDPRITPLGRFLRRTSLDELPQLLNVVLGDMSLVGPRPLPLRDVRHFSHAALMRRFSVRPGVTGLWQVSGRSELGFDDWIRLDLRYIDGWSIGLDLKILLLTIPAVFRGAGAC